MEEIQQRWSPRAFSADRPVDPADLDAIVEAAHFAPSCMNEQHWRILVANKEPLYEQMLQVLTENNQSWARHAVPVLYQEGVDTKRCILYSDPKKACQGQS